MFFISAFLLMVSCCIAVNKKNDPNYSEEFYQVYDAELRASIVVACGVTEDRVALSRLKPVALALLGAFQEVNFHSVLFFVCDDIFDNFHNRTGVERALLRNISKAAVTNCDVLVLLDSLPSKDETEASRLAVSRFTSNQPIKKLRIFCNLNLNLGDLGILETAYDVVLLSSKSEKYMLSQSWTAALAWKTAPPPTIATIDASAIAIQHNILESHGVDTSRGVGKILRRKDSITVFLQNILSSTVNTGNDTALFLQTLRLMNMRKKGPSIRHVYWLYSLSGDVTSRGHDIVDDGATGNKLLELTGALQGFQLETKTSFTILPYDPTDFHSNIPVDGNVRSVQYIHFTEALRISSVAWVHLSRHLDFNNFNKLVEAEEFFIRAGASGCISIILTPHLKHLNNPSPGVQTPSTGRYQYLVDDVNVFAAGSIMDLVSATEKKILIPLLRKQNTVTGKAIQDSKDKDNTLLSDLIVRGIMGSTFKLFTEKEENIASLRNLTANFSLLVPDHEYPSNSYTSNLKSVFHGIGNTLRNTKKSTKYSALIIEARIEGSFEFCVRNVIYHLGPSWGLLVFHSTGRLGNEAHVKRSLKDISGVQYVPADSVYDGNSYNVFVKSPLFWQNLKSMGLEKVLIFQTDSLLLKKDGIEDFLGWDYIGAPWHTVQSAESGKWLRQMQRGGALSNGVGNGGTSLRTVAMMLELAEIYKLQGERGYNEDTFFAHFCEKHFTESNKKGKKGGCMLANREAAYSFAVEIPPPYFLTNRTSLALTISSDTNSSSNSSIPFALHNIWSYISPALSSQLLQLSILKK